MYEYKLGLQDSEKALLTNVKKKKLRWLIGLTDEYAKKHKMGLIRAFI